MSDFEQWYENELSKIHYGQIKNGMKLCWQAAKQSMQGEAVPIAWVNFYSVEDNNPEGRLEGVDAELTETFGYIPVFTHAPDSAARIAEQKVPPGYALVPIVTTRAMDDVMRDPDWQWTDVLAAAESITEDDYLEPYPPQAAEKIAEQSADNARLKAENETLYTTMMAAAVEIQEHWDAHCDDEGYGPANLIHRLESGIASRYGYDAKTVVTMESKIAEQDARIKELEQQLEMARKDAERYRWLRDNSEWGWDLMYEKVEVSFYLNSESFETIDEAIDAAIRQIGGAE